MNRSALYLALNRTAEGGEPEWVELLPPGPRVVGRDGREWVHDQAAEVVAAFNAARPLPLDYEHATDLAAPRGEPAPAAGWIEALELREGAIWGRVAWTPRGAEAVRNREYRFHSPVFTYEKLTGRILRLDGAALTNSPNLPLRALNREHEEGPPMKRLLDALGLAEAATEDQAVAAVSALRGELATATNRAETPDLERFVPRADYDAAVARATNAEQQMADRAAAARNAEIETAVDEAVAAGKVTPATADYYRAMCRAEGGLEKFREFVLAAPVIGEASELGNRAVNRAAATDEATLAVAKVFGHTAEDLKTYGK